MLKTDLQNPDPMACVIIASGLGRRFGADKLAHRLPSGLSILEQTVQCYQAHFAKVWLVVRPERANQFSSIEGVEVLTNKYADLGMSQSIICAVQNATTDLGWLFALGDMPYVSASTIKEISTRVVAEDLAAAETIVQPSHKGKPGNPVFIGKSFATKLSALTGDVGAKQLIKQVSKDQLVRINVNDSGIHQDIDVPQDILFQN